MCDKCKGSVQLRIVWIYYWIIKYIFLFCFHPFVSLTHLSPKKAHQANVEVGKAVMEAFRNIKKDVDF